MARKTVFLDRDGTINVDHGYVYRREDWQFTDRAIEALKLLRDAGYALAVVTNQSGIARGFYTIDDMRRLHSFVEKQLAEFDVCLDAIAFCPHGPEEDCACRKPRTAMANQIEQALGDEIDYPSSWIVGDKIADIQFGTALGTRTALLRSRYWTDDELTSPPDLVGDSLYEAAVEIVAASD